MTLEGVENPEDIGADGRGEVPPGKTRILITSGVPTPALRGEQLHSNTYLSSYHFAGRRGLTRLLQVMVKAHDAHQQSLCQ